MSDRTAIPVAGTGTSGWIVGYTRICAQKLERPGAYSRTDEYMLGRMGGLCGTVGGCSSGRVAIPVPWQLFVRANGSAGEYSCRWVDERVLEWPSGFSRAGASIC